MVKIDAPMTSHITIHGNDVPGMGAKMKLTNGPVKLANAAFTLASNDIAASCAAAGVVSAKNAKMAVNSL